MNYIEKKALSVVGQHFTVAIAARIAAGILEVAIPDHEFSFNAASWLFAIIILALGGWRIYNGIYRSGHWLQEMVEKEKGWR
ncbi:MAG: hypothetical protein ACK4UN_21260 [Limisphaerales bacterium]